MIKQFFISRVRYNGTHIEQVTVSDYNSTFSGIDDGEPRLLDDIVDKIQNKKEEFVTVYFNESQQKYELGKIVRVFPFAGNYYLRTDDDKIKENNLGNLPSNAA
ncbi:MAG: DUF3892 domain-containing protein [Candidatus Electrothrix sp. Rat3]|nr:DUF3892 domain-containing protein [Candidatus Electrothrix rattekaaiensis]